MKLLNAGVLLNLFIAAITKDIFAAQQQQRYVIVHPDTKDPLECLGGTTTAGLTQLLKADDHRWSSVTLTPEQAQNISAALAGEGIVALDDEFEIPFEDTTTSRRLRGRATAEVTQYLNDYPDCNAQVNGVDVIVADTVLYANSANFNGFNVQNLKSYVEEDGDTPTACNPHGSHVASIILGNNNGVIRSGNIKIIGVGIAQCNGRGFVTDIISSIQDTINHDAALKAAAAKGQPLRRTLYSSSVLAGANSVLDTAVAKLYSKGIPAFVAAGNYARNACDTQSPARAEGVFAVGATQPPGDEPALFTNYGEPCVRLYLPGSPVTAINPVTGLKIPVSGTSFSTPIGSALGAIELSRDLFATPDQVYSRILNRTVVVPVTDSVIASTMRVMPTLAACVVQAPTAPTTTAPTMKPTTAFPTVKPTTAFPTKKPTTNPTAKPTTASPTKKPTLNPTLKPTTTAPTTTLAPITATPTPAPTQLIFTSYNTVAADNNQFRVWRNLMTNNALCFKFDARFTSAIGWIRIGLRNRIGSANTIIKIGEPGKTKTYLHTLKGFDLGKAITVTNTTTARIVYNTATSKTIQVESNGTSLLISYFVATTKQPLLALTTDAEFSQVAFSSGGNARVKYSNAMTC